MTAAWMQNCASSTDSVAAASLSPTQGLAELGPAEVRHRWRSARSGETPQLREPCPAQQRAHLTGVERCRDAMPYAHA